MRAFGTDDYPRAVRDHMDDPKHIAWRRAVGLDEPPPHPVRLDAYEGRLECR